MSSDRIKGSFRAFVKSLFPRLDYACFYRCKLVSQSSDLTMVDVQPDDPKIPGISNVPLKLGIPGAKVKISQGAYLLVGWESADPRYPFAQPSFEDGATVEKLVLKANAAYFGGESGAEPMLHAATFLTDIATLISTLNTILLAGTAGSPVKQLLTQAAQFAASPEYAKIQTGTAYKSTVTNNT